jgi:hypothetical protein
MEDTFMAKYTFIAAAWTKGASAFAIPSLPLETGRVYESTRPAVHVVNRILRCHPTALDRLKYGLLFFIQGEDGNVKGYRVKGPVSYCILNGVSRTKIQELEGYPNDKVKRVAQSVANIIAALAKATKKHGELLPAVYMQEEHK